MYVTLTRNFVTPALQSESFLAEEARILQSAGPIDLSVKIAGNMASYVKAGLIAVVAIISMLAF